MLVGKLPKEIKLAPSDFICPVNPGSINELVRQLEQHLMIAKLAGCGLTDYHTPILSALQILSQVEWEETDILGLLHGTKD